MPVRRIASPDLTHTTAGLVGEHIAVAAILQQGWGCSLASQDSVDLVAWNKTTGQRLLIQVKSCQLSRGWRNRLSFQLGLGGVKQKDGTKKKRLPTIADFDIMALVSSEQRAVFFMPVTAVKGYKVSKEPHIFDDPHVEADTWRSAVEAIDEFTKQKTMYNHRHRGWTSSDS